jgi:hypothetical protein
MLRELLTLFGFRRTTRVKGETIPYGRAFLGRSGGPPSSLEAWGKIVFGLGIALTRDGQK